MELKRIFTDDDAVSSVIAVILLVAITIILASLTAVYVLDVPLPSDDSPQTKFEVTQTNESVSNMGWSNQTEVVTIEHKSGDNLDESQISITVNGLQAYNDSSGTQEIWTGSSEITTSEAARVVGYDGNGGNRALQEDDEIRLTWENVEDDTSATLLTYTVD